MLDPIGTLLELAAGALGRRLELRRDRSWPHGEARVVEVTDAAGAAWIVKQSSDAGAYEREVHALRAWAPRLGRGLAPSVAATVPDRSVLVMDRLPGDSGVAATAEEFRQAGRLIRRLHDAEEPTEDRDYPARAAENVARWLRRCPGVVDERDLDFVRAQIALLGSMEPPWRVPVHNDNQPRNWLTDRDGTVRLIDFGRTRIDVRLRDFDRMRYREWNPGSGSRDAFFDGYGRVLTDTEERTLACMRAVSAVTTILWARTHADGAFEREGRRLLDSLRDADTAG